MIKIEIVNLPKPDPLMMGWLKIYFEEKVSRSEQQKKCLKSNGSPEPTRTI